MKNTMYNHPVQLVFELCPVLDRIFPDTVNTYKKVTWQPVAFTIVKGDNIREIVMAEISAVDIKDIIVRTEDDGYVAYPAYLALGNKPQPLARKGLLSEYKFGLLKMISNHGAKFSQIYNI